MFENRPDRRCLGDEGDILYLTQGQASALVPVADAQLRYLNVGFGSIAADRKVQMAAGVTSVGSTPMYRKGQSKYLSTSFSQVAGVGDRESRDHRRESQNQA